MPREKETRVRPVSEVRAVTDEDGTRRIEGYAIRFNEASDNLGGWVEYIDPGAVKLDPDLRAFFEADVRWLAHYGFRPLDFPTLAGGLST